MSYIIKVIPQEHQHCYVTINGLLIGTGPLDMCNTLADELRSDEDKAKLVYDLEKKSLKGENYARLISEGGTCEAECLTVDS